jgi:hypothetical protein
MQLRELREYCERRGWSVAGEYVDLGISGTKEKRPEPNRLMADVHRSHFDAVIVWKFDRFARSVSHLLRHWKPSRPSAFTLFLLDTATPAGKMVFTVLGAVAELERSLIVESVKAVLRNAKAKDYQPPRTGASAGSGSRMTGGWGWYETSIRRSGFQNSGKGFLKLELIADCGAMATRLPNCRPTLHRCSYIQTMINDFFSFEYVL